MELHPGSLRGGFETAPFVGGVDELRWHYDQSPEGQLPRAVTAELLTIFRGTTEQGWQFVAQAVSLADSLFNLGAMLWDLPATEGAAVEVMRESVLRGSADASVPLGEYLLWRGEEAEAVQVLADAAHSGLDFADRAAGVLGSHYFRVKHRVDDETQGLLERGARTLSQFRIELGEIEVARGQFERARVQFRIESERGNPDGSIHLGNLLAQHLGDPVGAEAAYRTGISQGDPYSGYNLALLLERTGRGAEAVKFLQMAHAAGDARATVRLRQLRVRGDASSN